ncbi:MAG: hypothetical protein ACPG5T_09765, partial [Endozoicomonas sp.]
EISYDEATEMAFFGAKILALGESMGTVSIPILGQVLRRLSWGVSSPVRFPEWRYWITKAP